MGSNDQNEAPDPAMTIAENCKRVMKYCDACTSIADLSTEARTDLPRFVRAVEYAFKLIDDLAQGDDENFWHWGNGAREKLTRILNGEEGEPE